MRVGVVDLGCANLASVSFALERLGAQSDIVRTPSEIEEAERLILPGVGAASYAAARLDTLDLRDALGRFVRPLMGICLGMQLLFERSEEGDARGLGLLNGVVSKRTPEPGETWPHMGWSRVRKTRSQTCLFDGVADGSYFYFVHGYGASIDDATAGEAEYGGPFAAAIEQGNLFGCQFHPERSGEAGARVLANFLSAPC